MNKNLALASVVFSSALLACGGGDQSNQQGRPAPQAVPVSAYQVTKEEVHEVDTYPGTVVALNEVELRAEVNGYITAIYVADGQTVQNGDKLYEIDQSRYAAAYRSAQAQVQSAEADLERMTKDYERYTRLAQQDAIAKQRVDYAQADLKAAQSQLSTAEAALSTAATDLRRSVILAPVSGKIGISLVRRGSLVTAGSTLINTISSPNPIGVDIFVSQNDIQYFRKLQQGVTSEFNIVLPDQSKYNASGRVLAVDRMVDQQTGTLRIRTSFPNESNKLTAGMNVIVEVPSHQSGEQIVIPYAAVTEQLGRFSVFVIGDSSKVAQRPITLGIKTAEKVVIQEGLKEGETIVSEGTMSLKEGTVVQQTAAPAGQAKPKN